MRSVIIASILFIILTSITLINSLFITSNSSKLIESAQSLPEVFSPNCIDSLNELNDQWNKFKKAASYTVSYSELNRISCLIKELYIHYYNQNQADFNFCLRTIINCLEELSRFERFSFEAIF